MTHESAVKASARVASRRLDHLRTFAQKISTERREERPREERQVKLSAHKS